MFLSDGWLEVKITAIDDSAILLNILIIKYER